MSDSQEKIMGTIKNDLFNKKSIKSETIVLYYSGHGEANTGALLLFGENNTKRSVYFKDIANLWEKRENKNLKNLFIILDSCYSFKWIE